MKFEDLSKEDIELIKIAMLENAVTLRSEVLGCEDVMPKEVCAKNMDDSDRLIYLVNVLDGAYEYDR
jgi:CBS-domain-containing membrane protein